MDFLADLGETNKTDNGTLQRIFTCLREKTKKRETTGFQVFPGRAIADRFSNFSSEALRDTGKMLMDFLVRLGEMDNFYHWSDPFLLTLPLKLGNFHS